MPAIPFNPLEEPAAEGAASESKATAESLAAEDFYMEGPYVVFTAAYHLRRGYCCNSDCRHCPYRDPDPASAEA
jgi:hypothetical protein